MPHQVQVVVISDQTKDLGPDVKVVVERPKGDPWTFPFAHKRILAQHLQEYDLFIYSEDDTLITERNINAFLKATDVLAKDEIAGFLRYEVSADGSRHCSSIHGHFHWDARSVVSRGDRLFAFFTNEHSACYVLTRDQLTRAIQSGGYLVEPHQEKYDLLVTAATDPYTQCGFKKLINFSHLEDFFLPHLPNKYLGQIGIAETELRRQVDALTCISAGARPRSILFDNETTLLGGKWSKSYYEGTREDLQKLIPAGARKILSYGCGWGQFERFLMEKGFDVTAIPVDSVIGACAEARGIKTVYSEADHLPPAVTAEKFDCVLILGALHLLPTPKRVLSDLASLLSVGGTIVCSVPNMRQLPVTWRRLKRKKAFKDLSDYPRSHTHISSSRTVREWLRELPFKVQQIVPVIPNRAKWAFSTFGNICTNLLASELIVVARKL